MPGYFPQQFTDTFYETVYESFHPQEHGLICQEFLGVYLRRKTRPDTFEQSMRKLDRRLQLRPSAWRIDATVAKNYLNLVMRHYILGATVMFTKRHLGLELPGPSTGCVRDSAAITVALRFLNTHRTELHQQISATVERAWHERMGCYYILCVMAFDIARKLFSRKGVQRAISELRQRMRPGNTPMGAELELSNLGQFAPMDIRFANFKGPAYWRHDARFHNMQYYHDFFLDQVCWRLGGYLDHHITWRKYLHLPIFRVGGFFEYSLVRLDYARKRTLPFTRDIGLLAQVVEELMEFVHDVTPFSMHVNMEYSRCLDIPATLEDYKCLFILGGDFGPGPDGHLMERRIGRDEIRGLAHKRQHRSGRDNLLHTVVEFSFIRLLPRGQQSFPLEVLLMCLKGFLFAFRTRKEDLNVIAGLTQWSGDPRRVPAETIDRFCNHVIDGLAKEGSHQNLAEYREVLRATLHQRQKILPE